MTMENLYDDLENYEEDNIVEALKNENSELKVKLEQYSSTLNQLQIDFENLNCEYKKLELNFSSLLKTAKAEIERKTEIITQLNVEKDMMMIQAFQNKGKRNLKNVSCKKDAQHKTINRPQMERVPFNPAERQTSAHVCEVETKENKILKSKQTSKHIIDPEKCTPIVSHFKSKCDNAIENILKEQEQCDVNVKNSDSFNYESKHLFTSTSTKSDDWHSYSYRHRDKSRPRRRSPRRRSRPRSRSPPSDRFSRTRHRSRDRRYSHYELEHPTTRELAPHNQLEQHAAKHKPMSHCEEAGLKRFRVSSYGSYPPDKSAAPAHVSPEDSVRFCQSPDFLTYDVDHSAIKEIIHTATIPQEDPRINSRKYFVEAQNGGDVLKSVSSVGIRLERVNTEHWDMPKSQVQVPDALLQEPPPMQTTIDDLRSDSDIGFCISDTPAQNSCVSSNALKSKEALSENSGTLSQIPLIAETQSLSRKSQDNSDRRTGKTVSAPEAKLPVNNHPLIIDTRPQHKQPELGCIGSVEGDLMLSDEASDNADTASAFDHTALFKFEQEELSNNQVKVKSNSDSNTPKIKKKSEYKDANKELDNKVAIGNSTREDKVRMKNNDNSEKRKLGDEHKSASLGKKMRQVAPEPTTTLPKGTAEDAHTASRSNRTSIDSNNSSDKRKDAVASFNVKDSTKLEACERKKETGDESSRLHRDTSKYAPDAKTKDKQAKEESADKPKTHAARKRKQCLEDGKENICSKRSKSKHRHETKPKEAEKSTPLGSNSKFSELFGESSGSLIMPEDLGIGSREGAQKPPAEHAAVCDDTQNAGDNPFANMTPAGAPDDAGVVIISSGVQAAPPLAALATSTPLKDAASDEAGQRDVPDLRIFVKRRRRLKKP